MRNLKLVSISIASISILFAIVLAFSAINVVHAIGVNATIPGGRDPMGIVYDSGMNEIITANYKTSWQGSNTANSISTISDSLDVRTRAGVNMASTQAELDYLGYPINLAYAPDQNLIFVSCAAGGVAVVSDKNLTVVARVRVWHGADGIAYDSGKKEVFVAGRGSVSTSAGIVSVIDIHNKVIKNITVGITPTGVAYDSGTGEIYVTNADSNTVSVISDETNQVVATVNVGTSPTGVVYDSGVHKVFVSGSPISVISDDASHSVVATITSISNTGNMAYDSGKGQIWVVNNFGVSVITDSDYQVVASVGTTGNSPYGIAYDSGKGEVFVTNPNEDSISMISDSFSFQKPTQTTGSLIVNVKDSSGGVLSGVDVSSTNQPSGQSRLSGTTGSDGLVTFSNVLTGAYAFIASKSGYLSVTGTGSVAAGSSASVNVVLQTQPSGGGGGGGGGGGVPGFPIEGTVLGIILICVVLSVRKRPSS